jgi:hypothetical protein
MPARGREKIMIFEFTLRVDREVTADEVDSLYGRFGDGSVVTGPGQTEIEFARQGTDWAEAIASAIRDVESIPGLVVTGAGQDGLVSMLDIAHRTHRSREAVRLWQAGKRGPGGFPAAAWQSPGGERFWSWADVAWWVHDNLHLAVEVEPQEVRRADEILKARQAVAGAHRILEEDESMREHLGPLLGERAGHGPAAP